MGLMKRILRALMDQGRTLPSEPFEDVGGSALERDERLAASSPSGELSLYWPWSGEGAASMTAVLRKGGREVLAVDRLVRPEEAHVADDGTVIILDWGRGSALAGTVVVADCERGVTLRMRLRANLGCAGISGSGRFAAFHTYGSNTPDGERLFFVDLPAGSVRWKTEVPEAWPDRYTFDEEREELRVTAMSGRIYNYGFNGCVLDAEAREQYAIAADREDAYGYRLFDRALSHLSIGKKEAGSEDLETGRKLLLEALDREMSPNTRAKAFRILGELAEKCRNWSEAYDWYTRALEQNPQIGVKRRLARLARTLEGGTEGDAP